MDTFFSQLSYGIFMKEKLKMWKKNFHPSNFLKIHIKPPYSLSLRAPFPLSQGTISCFVLSFTDSFRDHRGKVHYGIATFGGLWIMDGSSSPDSVIVTAEKAMDFVHALATFDQNIVKCFYLAPSKEAKELFSISKSFSKSLI